MPGLSLRWYHRIVEYRPFIDSLIASGNYRTADEVIEDALRQLESRLPKSGPAVIESSDAEIELGSLADISALMSQMQRDGQAAEAEEAD